MSVTVQLVVHLILEDRQSGCVYLIFPRNIGADRDHITALLLCLSFLIIYIKVFVFSGYEIFQIRILAVIFHMVITASQKFLEFFYIKLLNMEGVLSLHQIGVYRLVWRGHDQCSFRLQHAAYFFQEFFLDFFSHMLYGLEGDHHVKGMILERKFFDASLLLGKFFVSI